MNRRDFIKLTGLLGAGTTLPLFPSMNLFASHENYAGPLWLMVDARGGWDPTSLIDPKGYTTEPPGTTRINNYPSGNIQQIGNIRYAPPPDSFLAGGSNFNANLFTAQEFFNNWFQRTVVINGIDYRTNGHDNGQRHGWSGELVRRGYPNFGALVAGTLAGARALPFITNGGYDYAADLTVPVSMNTTGQNVLFEVARPNHTQPNNVGGQTYHTPATEQLIRDARRARGNAMLGTSGAPIEQRLPQIRASIQQWLATDQGRAHLEGLALNLEDAGNQFPEFDITAEFRGRGNARSLYRQGRLALAAFQEGVTAAAHIAIGGFDTHGNHDANHYPRLMDFIKGIDAILKEAERRNLTNRLVLVVGSDFARTNHYNGDAGKDHWSIGSMMVIGNGNSVIPGTTGSVGGNQVFGATTSDQRVTTINPATGIVSASGTRVTCAHVHRRLRELAGISTTANATNFSLSVPGAENLTGLFTTS